MKITDNETLALSPKGSANYSLSFLPVRQTFVSRGEVFLLARNPILVVLKDPSGPNGWGAQVIASANDTYPVNGYDLWISNDELARSNGIGQTELLEFAHLVAARAS